MAKPGSKRLEIIVETEEEMLPPPNCAACTHSFMEPDDHLTCGHPDAGPVGKYAHRASAIGGHCGLTRHKFEQHPLRNPDGSLT